MIRRTMPGETMSTEGPRSSIREKLCESCGTAFECRAGDCWCDEVALTDLVRAELRARYRDCLCPTCLTARQQAAPEVRSADRA
jgi:hypothetical protein